LIRVLLRVSGTGPGCCNLRLVHSTLRGSWWLLRRPCFPLRIFPFLGRHTILGRVLRAFGIEAIELLKTPKTTDGTTYLRMFGFVGMLGQLGVEVQDGLGHLPDKPRALIGQLQTFEEQGRV
jgi:hypothetical protein